MARKKRLIKKGKTRATAVVDGVVYKNLEEMLTTKPLKRERKKLDDAEIKAIAACFFRLASSNVAFVPVPSLKKQLKLAKEEVLRATTKLISFEEWVDTCEKGGIFARSADGLHIPPEFARDFPPFYNHLPESRMFCETLTSGQRVNEHTIKKETFEEGIRALSEEWPTDVICTDRGDMGVTIALQTQKRLFVTHAENGIEAEIDFGFPLIRFLTSYWAGIDPSRCIRVKFSSPNLSRKTRERMTVRLSHPHVDDKGRLCLGHTKAALNKALMEADFLSAADMVMTVLGSYSDQDPFLPLFPNWTKIPQAGGTGCIQCSTPGTTYYCEHKDHGPRFKMCGHHGHMCTSCGRPFCGRHIKVCGCLSVKMCSKCEKLYESEALMCNPCGYTRSNLFRAFSGEQFPGETIKKGKVTDIPPTWTRERTKLTLVSEKKKEEKSDKDDRLVAEPVPE